MGVTGAELASGVVPPPSDRVLREIEICPAPCPALAA
jgi:hypothetical protein